jgi:predicted nucleic acid-binding Zn ribbon protein
MKKWSNEELSEIISLVKEGKTYKEISIIYNRNEKSIRCKVNTLGIKSVDFKKYKKDTINKCLNCETEISYEKKFCSHKCSANFYNIKGGNRTELDKNNIREGVIKYLGYSSIEEWKKLNNIDDTIHFCKSCGKELKKRKSFCNYFCQHNYNYLRTIEKWKNNDIDDILNYTLSRVIRLYLFEKYDNKCSKCGWSIKNEFTNNIPLEVEHIDGNSENNNEENLTLLCPNCHSLTKTYKGANRGNGRYNRRQRYKDNKSY